MFLVDDYLMTIGKNSESIDTVPLPEKPAERLDLVMKAITPVIIQISRDVMMVAFGSLPTPENEPS